jgi:two-component system, NtrC family, sensor kinase
VEEALETAVMVAWSELKQRGEVVRAITGVPPVMGHGSELTQVFVHLLLSAAQALKQQPGTITIGTASDEHGVVVTIRDTGRGIPPEHLSRIFDPFFTTRPPGHRTGMGLAVCHGIVSRHGGTIYLDSTPGRGSLVTVCLPAMTSAAVAA